MKAFQCDECGEFATYLPIRLTVSIDRVRLCDKHVDLCETCYRKLYETLPESLPKIETVNDFYGD